jgi:translation initiation factor RLI1
MNHFFLNSSHFSIFPLFPLSQSEPSWQEILTNFRGSELQNFFTKLLEDNIKAIIKPQYVDAIPRQIKGTVGQLVDRKDERKNKQDLYDMLDLKNVVDREIELLSGGELQRFAIAVTCVQVSAFLFDSLCCYQLTWIVFDSCSLQLITVHMALFLCLACPFFISFLSTFSLISEC